jgi:hypothetical protein
LRDAGIAGIVCEFEGKIAEGGGVGEADRGAIVYDPVGATGKEFRVVGGGADGKDAAAGGFAGADAGRGVFHDDAVTGRKSESGGAFEVGLGIGLAMLDVAGRDHVANERKDARGTKTDFGEFADGGGDDREAVRRDLGEQLGGAGQSDNVRDIVDFGLLHPKVFSEVGFGGGMGEEFLDADETGAAVGVLDNKVGVETVFVGPGFPDTGHGRGGINEDTVHIEEQGRAEDTGHWAPGIRNRYCGVKAGGGEGRGLH